MDDESLLDSDRQVMAEMYRMVITGDEGWMEFLEQHQNLLDADISIDHTVVCNCGRFFEQHPTTVEGTECKELKDTMEQIRTSKCKCLQDVDPLDPNPPVLYPKRATKRLLHAACASGYKTTKIVRYLLEKKVFINKMTNIYQYTPLFSAVVFRNKEIVELLLADPHIDINLCSKQGQYTPFMEAILDRLSDITALFLKCPQTNLNARNFRGETPVHLAARMGETGILEKILEAGADVNLRDHRDRTALMYSVMYDMRQVTKILLKYGGDVHLRTERGETLLTIAVNAGDHNQELTQILLDAGANPNEPNEDDYTPLCLATYSNFTNIVKLLMDYNVDIHHANRSGYQAVHIAAWNGFMGILTALLNAGAKADIQTQDLNTPLTLAAHGNHTKIVDMLLAKGCNVNNMDKDLDTALLYATFNSSVACTESLLGKGANPQCINRLGCTPLWNATYRGDIAIVKVLLKLNVALDIPSKGIDQHAQSDTVVTLFDTPRTALWVATYHGHAELAQLLITAGCRVMAESWIGQDDFPGQSKDNEELKEMLRFYHGNPLPLTFLCRIFLRRMAGREVRSFTSLMHIPDKYRNFIEMKDILE